VSFIDYQVLGVGTATGEEIQLLYTGFDGSRQDGIHRLFATLHQVPDQHHGQHGFACPDYAPDDHTGRTVDLIQGGRNRPERLNLLS